MNHTTILLTKLISKTKKQLDLLNYADGTKNQYTRKWKHFLKYAEQKGQNYFSKQLGDSFLENYYGIRAGRKLSTSQVFKIRTITILGEMLEHNCFNRCHQKPGKQAPPQFNIVLNKYEKLNVEKKISKRTIHGKKIILIRFLNFLNNQGIADIADLTSRTVFYLTFIH